MTSDIEEMTMATVKLLLKESIKNVGRVGDIVEVSPGYARNYLLPRDLAVQPTPNNVKKVEERRKEIERQVAREQVVAGVPRRHLHDVADAADVLDRLFQK